MDWRERQSHLSCSCYCSLDHKRKWKELTINLKAAKTTAIFGCVFSSFSLRSLSLSLSLSLLSPPNPLQIRTVSRLMMCLIRWGEKEELNSTSFLFILIYCQVSGDCLKCSFLPGPPLIYDCSENDEDEDGGEEEEEEDKKEEEEGEGNRGGWRGPHK